MPSLPASLTADLGRRLALCLAGRLWLACDQEGTTLPSRPCRPSRLQHLSDRAEHHRMSVDECAAGHYRLRPLFLTKSVWWLERWLANGEPLSIKFTPYF